MTEPQSPGKPLDFKAIHEGMGFHPFSTGLPYSPPQKPSAPKSAPSRDAAPPAGAVAAGVPRFAKNIPPTRFAPPAPGVSPSAIQISGNSRPVGRPSIPPVELPIAPTSIEIENDVELSLGAGYLARRFLAFLFDFAFNLSVAAGITFASLWSMGGGGSTTPVTDDVLIVGFLFFVVLNWFVMTLEEMIFKTTLGKKLLGLRFEGAKASSLLLRAFAFPVGVFFFGIGIFWAFFDSRKRCWHDLASKTQPLETSKA